MIVSKLRLGLLIGDNIPNFRTVSEFYLNPNQLISSKTAKIDTRRTEMKYSFRVLRGYERCCCC